MRPIAFTLIELLIVIAIAAIIAGALIPLFSTSKQDAKITKFVTLVDTLRIACEQYHFDTGQYADTIDLSSNSKGREGWDGPYINHPLGSGDNPLGSVGYLLTEFSGPGGRGFDLNDDGIDDRNLWCCGDAYCFTVDSEATARKIDDAIDKGMGGDQFWKVRGRVEFDNPTSVYIYLIGGMSS